jgi:hypothetical protein
VRNHLTCAELESRATTDSEGGLQNNGMWEGGGELPLTAVQQYVLQGAPWGGVNANSVPELSLTLAAGLRLIPSGGLPAVNVPAAIQYAPNPTQ